MKSFVARGRFIAGLLGLLALTALAAQPGKDYVAINPAQPTESGDKIEVLEVFSYMCPHCFHFEPVLTPWVKKLPQDVQFRRMPVVFGRANWETLARTYFALEALGSLDKVHTKIFEAIHEENVILQNKDELFNWIEKQGVDKKKFADTYGSFGVQTKIQRSNQRTTAYGVSGVPTLIIDGKYLVASGEGGAEAMLKTADQLIQMIRALKTVRGQLKPAAPVPAKPVASAPAKPVATVPPKPVAQK
jgi:protein dithiol oxidoreductase (disulfide-forming)